MNIVVLDGYALNPGDLSWSELERFGSLTVYDRTPQEEVAARAAGARIVLTNKTKLDGAAIRQLPELAYIGVLATGYDVVDVSSAGERGITVTNVPGYGTASVAQHVFSLLLELTNHVGRHAESVRDGDWSASMDWCYWKQPLTELAGKTMGIVGYGAIGAQVARIAHAFGMNVAASRRTPVRDVPFEGFAWMSLQELLAVSDVVSLHCPLTKETAGLINKDTLRCMKPTALLVNTARGGLIVEADLASALDEGKLAGAALDVLSSEPPAPDHPLLRANRCILSPHIAWATKEARARLLSAAADNVRSFLDGTPRHVVS